VDRTYKKSSITTKKQQKLEVKLRTKSIGIELRTDF
jgi:hypothetical protein